MEWVAGVINILLVFCDINIAQLRKPWCRMVLLISIP